MDKQSAPRTNAAIADDLERWFREVHETLPPTPARHAIEALRKEPPALPAEVEAVVAKLARIADPEVRPFAFDETMWKAVRADVTDAATLLRRYAQAVAEIKALRDRELYEIPVEKIDAILQVRPEPTDGRDT